MYLPLASFQCCVFADVCARVIYRSRFFFRNICFKFNFVLLKMMTATEV